MEEETPQSLADAVTLLARTLQQPCDTLTTPSKVHEPDQLMALIPENSMHS